MPTQLVFKTHFANIDRLIETLPASLSSALNKSLYDTRDRMARDYVSLAGIKGPGGRRLKVNKQLETGRSVFKVTLSKPTDLHPSGSVDIKLDLPKSGTPSGLASMSARELIQAFVHSTHEMFANKSKEQRIKMALGLYYRIKRGRLVRQAAGKISKETFEQEFTRLMTMYGSSLFPYAIEKAMGDAAKPKIGT